MKKLTKQDIYWIALDSPIYYKMTLKERLCYIRELTKIYAKRTT